LGRSIREAWTVGIWLQVSHADRIRGARLQRSLSGLFQLRVNIARPGPSLVRACKVEYDY
jgi:hypothetical protein